MRILHTRSILPLLALLAVPLVSQAGISVGVDITLAPPALPVYVQPPLPAPGYMWTPGYWAWGSEGYFWVPGTWVQAPTPGYLWTPGYWGWGSGVYLWHAGYWGPHIGFYGGVNYGFGYGGVGFEGGYWRGGGFYYNRAVANIGTTNVTNVYNKTVINNVTVNRVSYNGGTGGITARPSPGEMAAARDRHIAATPAQLDHVRGAQSNRALLASVNNGRPAIAATTRPGAFSGKGVVAASHAGAPVHSGNAALANRPRQDRPPGATGAAGSHLERPAAAQANLSHERPVVQNEQRMRPQGGPQPQQHASPPHNQPRGHEENRRQE